VSRPKSKNGIQMKVSKPKRKNGLQSGASIEGGVVEQVNGEAPILTWEDERAGMQLTGPGRGNGRRRRVKQTGNKQAGDSQTADSESTAIPQEVLTPLESIRRNAVLPKNQTETRFPFPHLISYKVYWGQTASVRNIKIFLPSSNFLHSLQSGGRRRR
jgi:hypothetical protein